MPDLEASVRAFETRYGLTAVAGGRHPGVGTANAIVPLGDRQYLELIAVVDRPEAERQPLRSRVLDALDRGATFAGWAARADDLDALRGRLELGPIAEGARERPDGVRLEWRTAELAGRNGGGAVPFLIEWRSREHPGQADARLPVRRIAIEDAGGVAAQVFTGFDLDVELDVRGGVEPRLLAVELEGLTIR